MSISSPQTLPALEVIDNTDQEALNKVINIVAHSFSRMPISLAVMSEIDGLALSESETQRPPFAPSLERRMQHFGPQIRGLAAAGAEVIHTGDWSAVAIWCRPDYAASPENHRPHSSPLVTEYIAQCVALQTEYMPQPGPRSVTSGDAQSLKPRPFYHLEYIARDFSKPSVRGAITAAFTPYLERAKTEGAPLWIEAGTASARDVYLRYGFRVVGTITIGRGRFDQDGSLKTGGRGVDLWAMLYDSHLS